MRCFSRAQNGILVASGGRTGGKLVATGGIATSLPPADILGIVYTLWNMTWLFLVLYWSLHNQFPWVCGLEFNYFLFWALLVATGGSSAFRLRWSMPALHSGTKKKVIWKNNVAAPMSEIECSNRPENLTDRKMRCFCIDAMPEKNWGPTFFFKR